MTPITSGGESSPVEWCRSSYNGPDGPDGVEVAATPGTVHVRDSKDMPGLQLGFKAQAWADFVAYAAGSRPTGKGPHRAAGVRALRPGAVSCR
ncbi:DUF397 domain-containing protein [Streptomyces sp. HMX112]|uniref:DUF397 domain-containing protein n=1 Tax=Streptomyces sp. HMX112 TaxID=3390850 RepID=UPI003A7F9CBB